MSDLFFTPSSIGYLAQILAAGLIIFPVFFFARKVEYDYKEEQTHFWLIIGVCVFLALFSLSEFIDVSSLPDQQLAAQYSQNVIVAGLLVCLIQVAYYYPALAAGRRLESRIVLVISIIYFLWEIQFAAYRYQRLFSLGETTDRSWTINAALMFGFFWQGVVHLRQSIFFSKDENAARWKRILKPQGYHAQSSLAFTLVSWAGMGLVLVATLTYERNLSAVVYHLFGSMGILLVMFIVALAYLRSLNVSTSFVGKNVSVVVIFNLLVFSAIGWLVAGALAQNYVPAIPVQRSFRFTPLKGGAYQVNEIPFSFNNALGQNLDIFDGQKQTSADAQVLDFQFPFFNKAYSRFYAHENGLISFDAPVAQENVNYKYGSFTGIAPLYLDLNPEPHGGVFLKQDAHTAIVTWHKVSNFQQPDDLYTFQLVLRDTGAFDVSYFEIPNALPYHPDAAADSAPWFSGVFCKDASACGFSHDTATAQGQAWDAQIITGSFAIDYYRNYRAYFHAALLPLIYFEIGVTLLTFFFLPTLFNLLFGDSLEALLKGARQVTQGDLNVTFEVSRTDELGFLMESFNEMTYQLRGKAESVKDVISNETPSVDDVELSSRQETILQLVAQGHTYKEVGAKLFLTEHTIKYHLLKIQEKLNLKTRKDFRAYLHKVKREISGGLTE